MSDLHAAERERFEAWLTSGNRTFLRLGTGYEWPHTTDLWIAWKARAALAPAVPPGWMLVPVEPTREQVMAAHNGPLGADEYRITLETESWLIEMYAAFIAAAPSAKEPQP